MHERAGVGRIAGGDGPCSLCRPSPAVDSINHGISSGILVPRPCRLPLAVSMTHYHLGLLLSLKSRYKNFSLATTGVS
eukprot:scaffold244318_cov17-Prasinocladus_malaysianus.AAC.1